jgi:DNA-binding transcriptional regulator YiaG
MRRALNSAILSNSFLFALHTGQMQHPFMRMDKDQYRAAIAALGLSQHMAAALLGVTDRTGRNWALGKTRIPGSVAILLRHCIKRGFKPWDVL